MNEKLGYESPTLVEIGTLHDLTLQSFNKVGPNADNQATLAPSSWEVSSRSDDRLSMSGRSSDRPLIAVLAEPSSRCSHPAAQCSGYRNGLRTIARTQFRQYSRDMRLDGLRGDGRVRRRCSWSCHPGPTRPARPVRARSVPGWIPGRSTLGSGIDANLPHFSPLPQHRGCCRRVQRGVPGSDAADRGDQLVGPAVLPELASRRAGEKQRRDRVEPSGLAEHQHANVVAQDLANDADQLAVAGTRARSERRAARGKAVLAQAGERGRRRRQHRHGGRAESSAEGLAQQRSGVGDQNADVLRARTVAAVMSSVGDGDGGSGEARASAGSRQPRGPGSARRAWRRCAACGSPPTSG